MKVEKTDLPGVLRISLDVFSDHRGEYIETYNEKNYRENGVEAVFVQDDMSVSRKDVLRGIHGDQETWKLISCAYGRIFCVIVNCDAEAEFFGKWVSFELSDANRQQVLAPPRHGVAHLVLSDKAIFHYKQSTYYNPSKPFTYRWNDPRFRIDWPIDEPILSSRDGA